MKKTSKIKRKLCLVISFPHVWVCIAILFCSIVSLLLSHQLYILEKGFMSSIFSNIFAGLITGLVICLMSGIKCISITMMKEKKAWLESLDSMIKQYINDYHNLRLLKFDKYEMSEKIFEQIYDCGSHVNWINEKILQSSFDKSLSFNPLKYCKNTFSCDALNLIPAFQDLHEKLTMIDMDYSSSKDIISYFDVVHSEIMKLNHSVCNKIESLEIRLSEIQKTII